MDTDLNTLEQIRNDLHEVYLTGRTRSLDYRTYQLKQLAFLIKDNDAGIKKAMREDLGRGDWEVEQSEILPSLDEIGLAVKRLPEWMKDEGGLRDAVWGMKGLNPRVRKQPKGVALIISPWNFPFILTFGVLVGAIAAGCPAVIKPSELAPACSALLAKLVPLYLDSEAYKVVLGGVEHSTKLLDLDWGHICFTGSSKVGRIVAEKAAKRLVPTTLELSGKNPVFIAPDADYDITARRIVSMKSLGCGQVCVAPDYLLCPRSVLDKFTRALKGAVQEQFPATGPLSTLKADHYSPLHSQRAYDHITKLLDIAEKEDRLIIKGERSLGNGQQGGRIGVSVVLFKDGLKTTDTEAKALLEEEVFGPVMVLVPVEDLEEGIEHVQRQPDSLALYVFSSSRKTFDHIINNTLSGGAIWNDCNMTPIARSLPFGGVGHSGTGSYHGKNGFETFSHRRALLDVPFYLETLMSLRYPPVSTFRKAILRLTIAEPVSFPRPVSVEHEGQARRRRRLLKNVVYLVALVSVAALARAWTGFSFSLPVSRR